MNNLGLNYGGFLENDFLFSPNIGQNMENRWLRWGKWNQPGRQKLGSTCQNISPGNLNKLDSIQKRVSILQKTQLRVWRGNPQCGKRYLQNVYGKGLRSRIYKELLQIDKKKTNYSIEIGQKTCTGTSQKRTYERPLTM